MNLETIRERKVGSILKFTIPAIVAMVLTSLIDIVDGFFIGNYVGTKGLAAVNLGLPIVYLFLAVGLMVSVGGSSIAGRLLGSGEKEEANRVFRQTMTICILVVLGLLGITQVLLKPMCNLFPADGETIRYFLEYYRILNFQLPIMVLVSSFGMFIRAEGNPMFVMGTNILAVIGNGILDYVFLHQLKLGVAGVAWASVLVSAVVLGITMVYFLGKKGVFKFGRFQWEKKSTVETFLNGSSEAIGEMSMCVSMAAYNYEILKCAGSQGLGAFTIIGYVSFVYSMVIIGFGQGCIPIVSFAYGGRAHDLAREIRNITMKMVTIMAVVVFLGMTIGLKGYAGLFTRDVEVIRLVQTGLPLQMTSFVFAGINTIASFYFTAIGKAKESAVISALRGLIVLMIAILVLPLILGINGVWLVSLTTETVTILFTLMYLRRHKLEEVQYA